MIWAANLAVVDFHPWPSRRRDTEHPDELRIDIDPQPGTTFRDGKRVAALVREVLAEIGYTGWPKTSGNRGIHVFCRIEPNWEFPVVRRAALAFAREVERRLPKKVTTAWWKEERGKRVFIDYNQNARDRTVASAYSVRGRPDATVSAPVTWDELPDVDTEDFSMATMPARFAALGDVHAGIDDAVCDLRVLLEWVERDEKGGLAEAPYPPNFPKMPGEPPRVQPSGRGSPTSRPLLGVGSVWRRHLSRVSLFEMRILDDDADRATRGARERRLVGADGRDAADLRCDRRPGLHLRATEAAWERWAPQYSCSSGRELWAEDELPLGDLGSYRETAATAP